jgi:hypothetical protein
MERRESMRASAARELLSRALSVPRRFQDACHLDQGCSPLASFAGAFFPCGIRGAAG